MAWDQRTIHLYIIYVETWFCAKPVGRVHVGSQNGAETKDGPPEGCLGYLWTWSKCPGIPGPCRWSFRQPCCLVATRQPDQEQVWSQHLLIQKHLIWFLLNGLNRWHHWRNHHTVSLLLRVSQNGPKFLKPTLPTYCLHISFNPPDLGIDIGCCSPMSQTWSQVRAGSYDSTGLCSTWCLKHQAKRVDLKRTFADAYSCIHVGFTCKPLQQKHCSCQDLKRSRSLDALSFISCHTIPPRDQPPTGSHWYQLPAMPWS